MKAISPMWTLSLVSYDASPPSVHTTTFDIPNFSRSVFSSGLSVVVSAVLPGLMQNAFLLALEVVVCAVIVDDGVVALAQFQTILVNVSLNVIHLFRKKRQCSIDLMYISFRLLNEAFRIL